MVYMTGKQIREAFIKFFEERQHLVMKSASLIPQDDPTLLLIGAGMAPFKPFFTGKLTPPSPRIVTCQKCIRTGDIENVGLTARHHTFFEMLGNFSFGDYFKKESVTWGWEFVTKVLQIPAEKLWITIHVDDDEVFDIWHKDIGVPAERIIRLEEENFWEIGPGPCGPCSEMHVDLGEERGCGKVDCAVGCDCDRYLEIWNHVFTQYNKELDGSYTPLEKKNIDTGAGLERIASILQNKRTNFETDLMFPIVEYAANIANAVYGNDEKTDMSLKVIADHARSVVFMVSDGISPSNEGRGYILRRLLRRAVRNGKLLGIKGLFLPGTVDVVVDIFGEHYEELAAKKDYIKNIIQIEEERFNTTLEQGIELLNFEIEKLKKSNGKVLSGDVTFKLYDTFGFPWELTEEILAEHALESDKAAFEQAMQEQRNRARSARKDKFDTSVVLDFTGCDVSKLSVDENINKAKVVLLLDAKTGSQVKTVTKDQEVAVVLDVTPFHAEGGGQVGDQGFISTEQANLHVTTTKKLPDGTTVQYCYVEEGTLSIDEVVIAQTDSSLKQDVARNHTATHLLHAALKEVLGEHVNQAGSYVGPDRLRFDFSHFSAVTKEELTRIEEIVNNEILQGKGVEITETSQQEAKAMGATALFGEKYGDTVRVVSVPGFSMELCGGTHVDNVAKIGLFKIVSESSTGAGIRRIEAVTGHGAVLAVQNMVRVLDNVATSLKCRSEDISSRLEGLQGELKAANQEINKLSDKISMMQSDNVADAVKEIKGIQVTVLNPETTDIDAMRNFGDKVRDKLGAGSVVVLFSKRSEDKLDILVMAGKEAIAKGAHSGKLIKEVAALVGGGGGGRPDMAQAGGKQPEKIAEAMEKTWQLIEEQIN